MLPATTSRKSKRGALLDNIKETIILASGSPRRKELLRNAGISFEVLVTDVDENVNRHVSPSEFVSIISKRKAGAAVKSCIDTGRKQVIIIAADTVVHIGDEILGKPADKDDAFRMLRLLENRWHGVYTGITVAFIDNDRAEYLQDFCHTKVKFKPLSNERISEYINTGEPFDKAGAYAVQGQGGDLVEKIVGDYNNVVGLPIDRLLKMLNGMLKLPDNASQ